MRVSLRSVARPAVALMAGVALLPALAAPVVAQSYQAPPAPPPGGDGQYRAPQPGDSDDGYQPGVRDARQDGAAPSGQVPEGQPYPSAPAYQPAPGFDDYDRAAPPGYDPSRPPPPPPGYRADPTYGSTPDQDQRYEAYAEDWSQRYCVKAHKNTAAGAVIGGLLGALVGSSVTRYRDQGTGALVGGIAGAAGGAAIGSSSGNETSVGCPPGYVVRRDAPAFYYDGPYYYAAPGWYQPWFFYSDRWVYRPYPYHGFYYGVRFYGGRGYYGRGYSGRFYGGRRY